MVASKVRVMTSDEFAAIDTIVLAFAADPMARWSWPGQRQFLGALPRLSRAFGGKAFAAGSAYCVGEYVGARPIGAGRFLLAGNLVERVSFELWSIRVRVRLRTPLKH